VGIFVTFSYPSVVVAEGGKTELIDAYADREVVVIPRVDDVVFLTEESGEGRIVREVMHSITPDGSHVIHVTLSLTGDETELFEALGMRDDD
jgi:hypothetical protein